jgi:hypothetical protein
MVTLVVDAVQSNTRSAKTTTTTAAESDELTAREHDNSETNNG